MKKTFVFTAISLIACGILLSCGTTKSAASAEKTVVIDDNTLVIELDSNPTTGFSWECEIANPAIAEIVSDTYEQATAPNGMVGVGGTQTFVFACKQTGSTGLTFVYRRSWQGGETAEIRRAQIIVNDKLKGEVKFFE